MKLLPFTSLQDPEALHLEAKLEALSSGFVLSFEVSGRGVDQILLNARNPIPARKKNLWKETCFECFFGVGNSKKYFEFNGSPSGDWALYSFDDVRQGMKDVPMNIHPVMEKLEKTADKILCVWRIPYFTDAIIQTASITAVMKASEGSSYWALKHAGEEADFHLRDSFIHRFV